MAAGIEEVEDNLCDRCGSSMCFCGVELILAEFGTWGYLSARDGAVSETSWEIFEALVGRT